MRRPRLARRPRRRDERGAALVLVVVMLGAICGCAAIAVDLGNLSQARQATTDAADAAALAGADLLGSAAYAGGTLSEPDVVTQVEQTVAQNEQGDTAGSAIWDSCTASLPSGWVDPADSAGNAQNCVWFNASSSADVIAVGTPPHLVGFGFGRAIGIGGHVVSALSTAEVAPGGAGGPCALCLMSPTGTDLSMDASGNFNVQVSGANGGSSNIGIASNAAAAADVVASGKNVGVSAAGRIDVVGGTACTKSPPSSPCYTPSPTTGAPPFTDPLANLGTPTSSTVGTDGGNVAVTCSGQCDTTLSPGIYSNISLTGSGQVSLALQPGIYVITGTLGLTVSGQATISGSGVLLYFTCGSGTSPAACSASGQQGGSLSLTKSGGASLDLSPPTSGPFAGVSIYYDRHDTSPLAMTVAGNTSALSGTIYAASSQMTLTSAGTTSATLTSLVDVGSLVPTASGTGGVDIVDDASQNAAVTSANPTPELCSLSAGNC